MKKYLRVSVRALVSHSLRSGDLDLESFGASSHPVDAIRAHQKVQASRPEGYRKEVTISRLVEDEDFALEVKGRIDGVWEQLERTVVEEIKTTGGDLVERARRENPLHWGQLQVYAYLYAEQIDTDRIVARLTYYQMETADTREIERTFSRNELGEFFTRLVTAYLTWMRRMEAWRKERDASSATTPFPFTSYRAGQREMAVRVYRTINNGGQLLVEAPTGIGKTQATLFPAVKALGKGETEKIFYLTARTTGRALAEEALGELRQKGLRLKAVTLTAKDKICFNPEKACNGEECTYARGFYDRLGGALEELFLRDDFSREAVEEVARRHEICPFELSLEIALWSDCIVCDYNYVFDPRVYLKRFFDDERGEYTFLVDEAHNLVDRARDMYSAGIGKTPFLALRREIDKKRHPRLYRSLGKVNKWLVGVRKRLESERVAFTESVLPEGLVTVLKSFTQEAVEVLAASRRRGRLLDVFFEAIRFLKVAERFDASYVVCYERRGRDVRVKLFCMDPSSYLSETLSLAKASIFFSATLEPADYFRATLGLSEEAEALVLPSPFPPEHLRVVVADRIATTYRRRDDTKGALASLLAAFIESSPGNTLIYFPSYVYLSDVEALFRRIQPGLEVLVQRTDMTERERAQFLARFRSSEGSKLVGFAVLGGFFGEAIDLVGERLMGAAIVGVGLPGLSPERDRIREHFEGARGAGFEYAYLYPGINRVLQAAGRVIRSEDDRGSVLLIDQRFTERRYRSLLPRHWNITVIRDEGELREALGPSLHEVAP